MSSRDFYSTAMLEKNLTNRKISEVKSKVEWLKIQWLHYKRTDPFCIFYKYSNNDEVPFDVVNIAKRQSVPGTVDAKLCVLYPNEHKIDTKKKNDLLELPPIHHNFYQMLKTTENAS
nr:unnamed protein product [Callosobruchus chinensis]